MSHIDLAQSTYFRAVSKAGLSRMNYEEYGLECNHHMTADSVRVLSAKVTHTAACESGSGEVVVCGTECIVPDARQLARSQLGIVERRPETKHLPTLLTSHLQILVRFLPLL